MHIIFVADQLSEQERVAFLVHMASHMILDHHLPPFTTFHEPSLNGDRTPQVIEPDRTFEEKHKFAEALAEPILRNKIEESWEDVVSELEISLRDQAFKKRIKYRMVGIRHVLGGEIFPLIWKDAW